MCDQGQKFKFHGEMWWCSSCGAIKRKRDKKWTLTERDKAIKAKEEEMREMILSKEK